MVLNNIPLYTSVLGIFLLLLVLAGKGSLRNNRKARWTLAIILLLVVHTQVDAYLFYNGFDHLELVGISYLHYHLTGGLFLIYTYQLFGIRINLKLWANVLVAYTLLRMAVLLPMDSTSLENYTGDLGWEDFGLVLDSFISNGLNIAGLALAFLKVRKPDFSVQLSAKEQLNYLWLKNMLVVLVFIYVALMVSTTVSLFYSEQWLIFWKVDSLILGLFFFVLIYFAIRFPVFSMYGDFNDLETTEKKYANSSLKKEQASILWQKIEQTMLEKRPFLDPEYRLNALAESTGESLHHVSQVINEQRGMSFNDYINYFRVQEAMKLLTSNRAKEVTILAISLEVGFNSKTAFYNAFKKHTGKTPTEFKKDHDAISN